ncbi:cellulase family glycosylhydrolase [Patulibacter defluvii]|uniref:cellulase family glycosylhydrolase n=1 Tax=Patulibacter defluvii TaxID=3095358 RepID=UPI002A76636C|nr:cellulase family glycosylhydrolase [Patulibacter sp. DM4]
MRSSLLTAAAIAAALLGAAAPASAAMVKGIEDDRLMLSDDPADRQAFWTAVEQARAKTVRVVPRWPIGAETVPEDTLLRLRRAVTEGQAKGAKLLVGIYQGIGRGQPRSFRVDAATQLAYVRFAGSLAKGLSDLPIAGYLTWNEPNYATTWPQAQAREWVTLSNRTYRAIRSADPGVPILAGEAAPNVRNNNSKSTNPGAFFRKALCLNSAYRPQNRSKSCRSTKLLADGITLHTYDFTGSPLRANKNKDAWVHGNLNQAVSQIRKLAAAKKITVKASRNVHITEFAYRSKEPNRTDPKLAATYTRQAWNAAKKAGIKSFIWYLLRDPSNPDDNFASGLFSATGEPYPVWDVFRTLR